MIVMFIICTQLFYGDTACRGVAFKDGAIGGGGTNGLTPMEMLFDEKEIISSQYNLSFGNFMLEKWLIEGWNALQSTHKCEVCELMEA